MERGTRNGPSNQVHREFRVAVDQARAEAEAILVSRISKAAQAGSWRAACWLLERRNPEKWASMSERNRADNDTTETEAPPDPLSRVDELAARRSA
jgi:hypothetical protein